MFLAGVPFLGHANELLALHLEQSDIRLGSSQVAGENHQTLRMPNRERKSISKTRSEPISNVERKTCLQRAPSPSIGTRQIIRRARPLAARRIVWKRRRRSALPSLGDGIHQRPSRLHAVGAVEKRGVAAYAIIDQSGVSIARHSAECSAILKIHGYRTDVHLATRSFGSKRKRNSFIRLNIQNDAIQLGFFAVKHSVRRGFELDDYRSHRFLQTLSCAQIKWHAAPAPVIHKELHGHKSFGCGIRLHSRLLAIAGDGLPIY